ncbi:MAG: hypothetical protein M0Q49_08715, partial [Porticoccaceae bacterium]|nr:hypothetical protein [Porticoccaceae bacterium]
NSCLALPVKEYSESASYDGKNRYSSVFKEYFCPIFTTFCCNTPLFQRLDMKLALGLASSGGVYSGHWPQPIVIQDCTLA